MFWRKSLVSAVIISMVALFGCATAPEKTGGTAQEEFEETPAKEIVYSQEKERPYSEEQAKETRFTALKEKIKEHLPVKKAPRPQHVASSKDIQTALKNAGYYTGNIDGKIGSRTDSAIKAFQKDNGIKVDGIVGQRTWNLLSKYLASPAPSQPLVAPAALEEEKAEGVVTITEPPLSTETTAAMLAEAPVTSPPIAEEGLPMVEEVPAPSRNFMPLIVVIIIILVIILGLSIYRRRSA